MSIKNNFLKKYDGVFRKGSKPPYMTLDKYKKELSEVEEELSDVESTIKYYLNRKHLLKEWKYTLEMSIGKWDDSDNCGNCKFFRDLYCTKFEFSVDREATCSSFEWCEDDLDL